MSLIDLTEVEYEAEDLLATEPLGDYERWTLELFRRRYAKEKAAVDEAEAAFRQACKGGTFTAEEAAAHDKTFREAETRRFITRASLSQLVREAASDLVFYRKVDKWTAADRREADNGDPLFCEYEITYSTLPGSPEEKRDRAILEAERQMKSDMADMAEDDIGFSRGSFAGRRRGGGGHRIVEEFDRRKAAIEEEYYAACV